jgi:hypothetical protein
MRSFRAAGRQVRALNANLMPNRTRYVFDLFTGEALSSVVINVETLGGACVAPFSTKSWLHRIYAAGFAASQFPSVSNGAYGQFDYVLDLHKFFLQEGFAVLHTN